MNAFLARQPIFDSNQKVYAYEILYRSGVTNAFTEGVGADAASSKVILDTFQNFGLENITGGKPAFINFSSTLIMEEIATFLPKEYLVVELLETIEPTSEIVEKCRQLKEAGYTIALDDFVYSPGFEPLIELADIIKVDFMQSTPWEIRKLRARFLYRNITFLAEKVETWDDFYLAKDLDFRLFQGYFFAKPEILTTNSLSPLEVNCFQLVSKVNQVHIDFNELATIIYRDLSLTYNLLRLVNSAAFGKRQRITSVHHALVMLGEMEIRKWVTLIALQGMSIKKADASVSLSLIRARFGELLAQKLGWKRYEGDLFLAGLFSMLDVLLQRPLESILEEVHASPIVKDILLNCSGPLADVYHAVLAYETGDWDAIEKSANQLNLQVSALTQAYLEAIQWHPYAS